MKANLILPLALLLSLPSSPSHAVTRSWTNTAGGNWNLAANWSPNGVPGAADIANITTAGTYTVALNANATVAVLNLGAASGTQTLAMSANTLIPTAGSVNANGVLAMSGGGIEGQLTVQAGGVLNFLTSANKNVYRLTLNNAGTVNHAGGQLVGGSTPGTIITNTGLWDLQADETLSDFYSGSGSRFVNTGTLRKSAGSGIGYLSGFDMDLRGLIEVQAGTLRITGNGSRALGAVVTVAAGAAFDAQAGNFNDAGGTFGGAGTSRFSGGTLTLNTNILAGLRHAGGLIVIGPGFQQAGAITNLVLDGSTLNGSSHRVGEGALTLNSGGIEGQLTVQAGGVLNFLTSANKNVYRLTLNNAGTVNHAGGQLVGGSTPGTIITNTGLWDLQADETLSDFYSGSGSRFVNTGTLRKSAGSGIGYLSGFDFVNQPTGLIQSDVGILQLSTPITNSARTLRLNGGAIQSGGTYGITGGALEGVGAFGANVITGGIVSPGQAGPGLMGFRSGLNLGAGATLAMSGTGTIPGTQYDQLSITGAVSLVNATLQVTSLPAVSPGTIFTLILNDGADPVSGTFNGLPENALVSVGAQPFRIHYAGGSGNDVTLVRDSGSIVLGPQLNSGGYANGTVQLLGLGSNGVIYTIQATTNFVQWTNIGFATGAVSGNFTFNDTNAFRFRYRFYRTRD